MRTWFLLNNAELFVKYMFLNDTSLHSMAAIFSEETPCHMPWLVRLRPRCLPHFFQGFTIQLANTATDDDIYGSCTVKTQWSITSS